MTLQFVYLERPLLILDCPSVFGSCNTRRNWLFGGGPCSVLDGFPCGGGVFVLLLLAGRLPSESRPIDPPKSPSPTRPTRRSDRKPSSRFTFLGPITICLIHNGEGVVHLAISCERGRRLNFFKILYYNSYYHPNLFWEDIRQSFIFEHGPSYGSGSGGGSGPLLNLPRNFAQPQIVPRDKSKKNCNFFGAFLLRLSLIPGKWPPPARSNHGKNKVRVPCPISA